MAEPATESTTPGAARMEIRDGIAWILLNHPTKKVNTLSFTLMEWLEAQLDRLEGAGSDRPKGVIIRSEKPGNFVAGADIEEIQALAEPAAVRDLLARGHAMIRRLEKLPIPVVAAIHGSCLGGGLELSLACRYRVATEDPKTKLGLPEVKIGIFPGLGGTQRLPRQIGVMDALPMILAGKEVDARKAYKLGLVDEICHPGDLEKAALRLIDQGRGAGRPPGKRPFGIRAANFLAAVPLLKNIIYGKARAGVLKQTSGHYPAPIKALEVVKAGLATNLDRGLEIEAAAFADLVVTDEAKRLMGIFFMKTDCDSRATALAKTSHPVDRVGVLGAGFMGAGIAQLLAHKGVQVWLKDRDDAGVARGLKQCHDLFYGLVKRRKYKPMELTLAMGRLHGVSDYGGFGHLPFVIEAVFEDVKVKHAVIREMEAAGSEEMIFASNTSTIPITRLAEASQRPENFIGMHFFSPVHKMPLLEIIKTKDTSEATVATTVEVGRRMGKTIIVVNDGAGFFTSRVLGPFVAEAGHILGQGARIEDIDRALKGWGWPVGPIALLDEVGIDVAAHAAEVMREAFGERMEPPAMFHRLIEDGRTGRKGRKGFYTYDGGPKKVDESVYKLIDWQPGSVPREEIIERCWFQMLNETAHCIQEGIIENPNDIDIGVIFGFGFPPFRGGLLHEADRVGVGAIVDKLDAYAEKYGERLRPAQLLRDMAKAGEKFHG